MANFDPPPADRPQDDEARPRWEEDSTDSEGQRSPEPDWDAGFSLGQLFMLLAVVSVLLAVIRCFSPQIAAGLAGLAVLVGLVFISRGEPPAIVQLTWWTVLAIYLAAAAIAVVRG